MARPPPLGLGAAAASGQLPPRPLLLVLLLLPLLLQLGVGGARALQPNSSADSRLAGAEEEPREPGEEQQQQQQQQQQPLASTIKLPLKTRIIATLACLVIFAIGVAGNLLVPLVVIKTKYLRNSTNLFLINLSIADLLVLLVCMPTVFIELHSRPETWLLGEPICKLSNFVEMLAGNGSIFTILAISFERYYAICKPLKAGYKCTRLRATVIISCIWLLSSLLTSPVLMMAKSEETRYIDGSLVYNCILETNSYWPKMYVFVSMFAFFCLPLLVLMLVYWLIGRRLIRENLAYTATTTASSTPVPASELGEGHPAAAGRLARLASFSGRHAPGAGRQSDGELAATKRGSLASAVWPARGLFVSFRRQSQRALDQSRYQSLFGASSPESQLTRSPDADGETTATAATNGHHDMAAIDTRHTAGPAPGKQSGEPILGETWPTGSGGPQASGASPSPSSWSHRLLASLLAAYQRLGGPRGLDGGELGAGQRQASPVSLASSGEPAAGELDASTATTTMSSSRSSPGPARCFGRPQTRPADDLIRAAGHTERAEPGAAPAPAASSASSSSSSASNSSSSSRELVSRQVTLINQRQRQQQQQQQLQPNGSGSGLGAGRPARQGAACSSGGRPGAGGRARGRGSLPVRLLGHLFIWPKHRQVDNNWRADATPLHENTNPRPPPSGPVERAAPFGPTETTTHASAAVARPCSATPNGAPLNLIRHTAGRVGQPADSGRAFAAARQSHHDREAAACAVPLSTDRHNYHHNAAYANCDSVLQPADACKLRLQTGSPVGAINRLNAIDPETRATGSTNQAPLATGNARKRPAKRAYSRPGEARLTTWTAKPKSLSFTSSSSSFASSSSASASSSASTTTERLAVANAEAPWRPQERYANYRQQSLRDTDEAGLSAPNSIMVSGATLPDSRSRLGARRSARFETCNSLPSGANSAGSFELSGQSPLSPDSKSKAAHSPNQVHFRQRSSFEEQDEDNLNQSFELNHSERHSEISNCGDQLVAENDRRDDNSSIQSVMHLMDHVDGAETEEPSNGNHLNDCDTGTVKSTIDASISADTNKRQLSRTTNANQSDTRAVHNIGDDSTAAANSAQMEPLVRNKSTHTYTRHYRTSQNHFHFSIRSQSKRSGSQPVCHFTNYQNGQHLSELYMAQDISKKQQMDSRRQVVVMLAFVVAAFFLLFFPYRVFTIWLILSTEDQVQSLGMETYYNLTYFSRILIYLHSAINPIAYNLISTKFRCAFMSILFCRGAASRRQFTTDCRANKNKVISSNNQLQHNLLQRQESNLIRSSISRHSRHDIN